MQDDQSGTESGAGREQPPDDGASPGGNVPPWRHTDDTTSFGDAGPGDTVAFGRGGDGPAPEHQNP
ncbi:MAG TPA: hypothetical protein VGD68_01895, partial [Streptosporangiaceae bacterium]